MKQTARIMGISIAAAKGRLFPARWALRNSKTFRTVCLAESKSRAERKGAAVTRKKIPALKALAPTQSEPPFLGAQVVVILTFIVLGVLAAKRFPAGAVHAA